MAVVLTVIRPNLAWREESTAEDSVAEHQGSESAKVGGVREGIPFAYDFSAGQQFVRRIRLQQSIDAGPSMLGRVLPLEMDRWK